MSGVEAVTPEDFRGEYNLASLLRGQVTVEEEEKPLHKRLIEAALSYIRKARIYFPHATLEVRHDAVVMQGVPHCGEILVCAVNSDEIHNYL